MLNFIDFRKVEISFIQLTFSLAYMLIKARLSAVIYFSECLKTLEAAHMHVNCEKAEEVRRL